MSDDKMQVGKVELTAGQHDIRTAPPKPTKRVAVQVWVDYRTDQYTVIANDGTMWQRINSGWTRLPDLPQE